VDRPYTLESITGPDNPNLLHLAKVFVHRKVVHGGGLSSQVSPVVIIYSIYYALYSQPCSLKANGSYKRAK
jgi:hypothetical protein